jgi:hypothetical protein
MQATCLNFKLSTLAAINRSIVQGSGIGPSLFIMFAFDLKPIDIINFLIKFADDSTLLCPENSNTTAEAEVAHILEWARLNKMLINLIKTLEIIFKRPNYRLDLLPQPLVGIERVAMVKLLGVHLCSDLKFDDHISYVIGICNQRLYLLLQLKRQGLSVMARDLVFNAIVVNKIMYALPVWYGYLTAHNKRQLSSIFAKAKRWGITAFDYDFEQLADSAQSRLFLLSKSSSHCLNHLYTIKEQIHSRKLRPRGHSFAVPPIRKNYNSKEFIYRALLDYL